MLNFKFEDSVTKFMFVVLVSVITYIVVLFVLRPIIVPENMSVGRVGMMGMMNFNNQYSSWLNITAIALAILVGFIFSFKLGKKPNDSKDELSIIKKALSLDEKKVLEEVEKAKGEITQDSLRFRLNWSKAKVSAIVSNLDRMNLIQRERQGKTYNILLRH